MKQKAKRLGITTKSITISGDVKIAAKKLAKLAPKKKNSAILFGGEPTVLVRGKGKGGRNQELVLRLQEILDSKLVIASIGTDGIDGNTKYAGAISQNNIPAKKIKQYLKTNNSNAFFQKYGGLVKTGYTHTNLQDIGLILS